MTEQPIAALAGGRRVTLLPRTGGHSWAGTVADWAGVDGGVVARIRAEPEAVASLDHHQVWLSTVSRDGDEPGVTIFAGRADAVGRELLKLEGVVRLADERRRQAVRATGSMVTLPPTAGQQRRLDTLDVSRGAVRLPVGPEGWLYDDPVDLVLHLGEDRAINVVGRLLRLDDTTRSVVLSLEGLSDLEAADIDRFALRQLPEQSHGHATAS